MSKFLNHSKTIEIRHDEIKGRCVFAKENIKKGKIIEKVPIIKINRTKNDSSNLENYVFYLDEKHCAIALGYGSLYNHSYGANSKWICGKKYITFVAVKNIKNGEEITINYNGPANSKKKLINYPGI